MTIQQPAGTDERPALRAEPGDGSGAGESDTEAQFASAD